MSTFTRKQVQAWFS